MIKTSQRKKPNQPSKTQHPRSYTCVFIIIHHITLHPKNLPRLLQKGFAGYEVAMIRTPLDHMLGYFIYKETFSKL